MLNIFRLEYRNTDSVSNHSEKKVLYCQSVHTHTHTLTRDDEARPCVAAEAAESQSWSATHL